MTRLIVAGGGGGDAVAAAVIDNVLYGADGSGGEPAVILTYSWDRLIVDPFPGPRGAADFTGLRPLTPSVYAVPADAVPVPPGGSTLPRLARELPYTFALIDPHHGVEGMIHQLEELVERLTPDSVDLLDVGGDILARGDEPTLRSPLGDALSLAACAQVNAEVRLLVAGPGLDGEIPPAVLRERLGPVVHTLGAEEVSSVHAVMEWHPSEATAMLVAGARGERGLCEIRDAGLAVPLTDGSPAVHEAGLDAAFERNRLAQAIVTTTSLDEAERYSRELFGYSEIDYERDKAAGLGGREGAAAPLDRVAVLRRLAPFEDEARARGVTHTTFRRLTEALGVPAEHRTALRSLLIGAHPERYAAPLWRL
ncbi:DUF1152 domain-containing protein [Streptomyces sp. NA02950]|uniref:DUF1152 domain-containing protein n=1 Tax=Streptomyces sp. NA02950 TaxID=2742137 RepID=UPI0015900D46|nr:DUF1152 domain-containing protein [Streptomyces sp. NA02950]QKV93538.1 DUF1152 domain-containing protein [Streptomyces sp. NA02950]